MTAQEAKLQTLKNRLGSVYTDLAATIEEAVIKGEFKCELPESVVPKQASLTTPDAKDVTRLKDLLQVLDLEGYVHRYHSGALIIFWDNQEVYLWDKKNKNH